MTGRPFLVRSRTQEGKHQRLAGFVAASRQYIHAHQQWLESASLSNAIDHLLAALDLRETIVREGAVKWVTVTGFVAYKAILALGGGFAFRVRRLLGWARGHR